MTQMRWDGSVSDASGVVRSCSEEMRTAGEDFFSWLKGLVPDFLEGEGIMVELENAHAAWNADCDLLTNSQADFANVTQEGLERMLDMDRYASGFFN